MAPSRSLVLPPAPKKDDREDCPFGSCACFFGGAIADMDDDDARCWAKGKRLVRECWSLVSENKQHRALYAFWDA